MTSYTWGSNGGGGDDVNVMPAGYYDSNDDLRYNSSSQQAPVVGVANTFFADDVTMTSCFPPNFSQAINMWYQ